MYEFPPKTQLGNFSFTIEALNILYLNYIYSVAMATLSGQDLHCGICSNVFTNPLMMPCLHSFCKKCLEQQLEEQGSSAGSIKCPTCDTVSTLPSGGVASLPSNHWLAHQAEVSTYQQKVEDGGNIPCERCVMDTSGAAVAFCCSCCLFLCSLCQEDHKRWRETVSHELVSVGEKKKDMDTKVKVPHKPMMCVKHTKEELKFYCDTCQCLICRDCIAMEHNDHKRVYPEDVAAKEKESLMETLQEAEDAITKLEAAITSRDDMKKLIEIQKDEVNEKIAQEFKMIYSSLQEREKALHSKCEEFANQKLSLLSMEMEEIDNLKRSLTFSTQTASGVENLSPAELLGTKKPIQEHLQNRLTSFARLDLEPGESDDISVIVNKTTIDEAIAELGSLSVCDPVQCTIEEGLVIPVATVGKKREVKVALRDSNGELVFKKVSITARVEVEEDGSVLPVDIRFEGDGHTLLSFQSMVVGEHRLTIKVKGKQLAGSPYRIWARQNTVRESISTGAKQSFIVGGYCYGVAVHHNGDVFASNHGNGCIQVFSSDGSQKLQIGSQGSGDSQLSYPIGLTIVGEVLYVADHSNYRVQKFTLTGEYLGQFGSKGSSEGQFSNPYGICADGRGRVLVADYSNNRVQVFTADGIFVTSISCNGSPYDVAVDNSGNIHVTLYSSHCVAVFSSDGKQLTTYGSSSDSKSPYGIAIDEEGYRYVSCYSNNRIYVFSPEGTCVSNYSCPSYPRCMTLDNHGNIYLASHGGNCVTKY